MSVKFESQAGVEVQELLGRQCRAEEPGLDSESVRSRQCGVVRLHSGKSPLAAESGCRRAWME